MRKRVMNPGNLYAVADSRFFREKRLPESAPRYLAMLLDNRAWDTFPAVGRIVRSPSDNAHSTVLDPAQIVNLTRRDLGDIDLSDEDLRDAGRGVPVVRAQDPDLTEAELWRVLLERVLPRARELGLARNEGRAAERQKISLAPRGDEDEMRQLRTDLPSGLRVEVVPDSRVLELWPGAPTTRCAKCRTNVTLTPRGGLRLHDNRQGELCSESTPI